MLSDGDFSSVRSANAGHVIIGATLPIAAYDVPQSCTFTLSSARQRYLNEFLRLAINARLDAISRDAQSRSTQARHRQANLEQYSIPLPPLAEQKRIVAKVDELMALCDRLEAQQQERETRHAALARASLARFADAPTPANLNFLFHKSYAIPPADLRKSILTLAVQGKLVPQDPNDEPVEAILTRSSLEIRLRSRRHRTFSSAKTVALRSSLRFEWMVDCTRLGLSIAESGSHRSHQTWT